MLCSPTARLTYALINMKYGQMWLDWCYCEGCSMQGRQPLFAWQHGTLYVPNLYSMLWSFQHDPVSQDPANQKHT